MVLEPTDAQSARHAMGRYMTHRPKTDVFPPDMVLVGTYVDLVYFHLIIGVDLHERLGSGTVDTGIGNDQIETGDTRTLELSHRLVLFSACDVCYSRPKDEVDVSPPM